MRPRLRIRAGRVSVVVLPSRRCGFGLERGNRPSAWTAGVGVAVVAWNRTSPQVAGRWLVEWVPR